jgi:hypothetical protein
MSLDRFVRMATLGDVAAARIVAARLESEGIEVRLHSESLGPYPMTVGRWAETELWVPESRLAEAEALMLEAEIDDVLGAVDEGPAPPFPGLLRLAAGFLAVLIAALVVRAVLWYF